MPGRSCGNWVSASRPVQTKRRRRLRSLLPSTIRFAAWRPLRRRLASMSLRTRSPISHPAAGPAARAAASRGPAAGRFVEEQGLNEFFDGDAGDIGIVMLGGMYNNTLRALELLGLADVFGRTRVPLYVLNVAYPLVDRELVRFCSGKRAVLLVEEGQPDFIEQAINTILRRADIQTRVEGKSLLPMAGESTGAVLKEGLRGFVEYYRPDPLAAGG